MSDEDAALKAAVAYQLRTRRARLNWSQDELAHRTGLGRRTVQRLEKGEVAMTLRHARAVSAAFGVHWLEFLRDVDADT
ncbi:repressor [Rhodococcus phage Mbo4]|uniref:Repressor n=2 Tax=root TaxID=1 RepID=A0A9E7INA4_9CAUD|nr:helix-turn-helix transcriptional regulator [Rhodococcus opacus]YP_010755933.1 repressor [Rhodococcus phage Mbo4]EKT83026.1 hypothetical protein WSS_A08922 [Rhodococcus opacus M213]URG17518.1 repressor [Rhodococcus phage Mbo4]